MPAIRDNSGMTTPTRTLKIAIVGTGKVTQNSYLPGLSQQPDVELGYYNRTFEKATVCAARFGGQAFPTLAELMTWQPDAVMILTRETDRLEATQDVLAHRPRRLFFEKPLVARNGQEHVTEQDFFDGQKILQQAERIDCETAMVFNYRFFEHTQIAKRIVAERDFGRVLNVTGLVHYACWSHAIDLMHFFAGPLAEVSALQSQAIHESGSFRAPDITLAFRTADDATGTLLGTSTLAWTFPLFELTFNFERGCIRMQDLDGDMTVMDAGGNAGGNGTKSGMEVQTYRIAGHYSRWDQYTGSFAKSVNAYLDTLRNNAPPPVPGRYGLLELQVEAAIQRSILTGKPVQLSETFPLNLRDEAG